MTQLFALQPGKPAQGSAATIALWSSLRGLNASGYRGRQEVACPAFMASVANRWGRRNDRQGAIAFSEANKGALGVLPL